MSIAESVARELVPLITRVRDETESTRRIAGPVVERLRDARLCRMGLPRELHGLELPLTEVLDVVEVLAGAEASVSWIVWNNLFGCFYARFLVEPAREEVFGDPRWLHAGSTRPTGRASPEADGYRVNGRWSLVSGCELAEWFGLLCAVEQDGRPRMVQPGVPEERFLWVRREDVKILDTWHTGGLRGTGSHDVVVTDQHVPRRLSFAPMDRVELEGPLGRLPILCTMAAGYAAQVLGIARVALDTLAGIAKTKVSAYPGPALGERAAVLGSIARHGVAVAAARRHLHACASELWDAVQAGAAPIESITAVWTAAHHALDHGRQAFEAMYAAGGTTSLYTSCPLERAQRDLHAMSRHIVAQAFWLDDAGRVLLGAAPTLPLYAF
jgi:indole-3-acetate monooxygenase